MSMGADLEVRDLTEDDLGWVAEQELAIFGPAAWSEATIHQDFRYGMKRYRGAVRNAELVGYAIYGYDGDVFHLMNIAVVEHARGMGVARALMDDFLGEARAQKCPDVWLEVAVTNTAALELYRSYGFGDVRVRPKYYQPGDVDGLVMRLRLM